MTKRKVSKRKISPLLAIAGIGVGAYFLLNSQKAQAQEMPPAGIGSGYGGGAILGTSGSPTTSAPTSSTGTQPVYNISFEAPAFESQNYGQEESVLTKKDALTQPTSTGGGGSRSITVGGYSGTATPLGDAGNQLVSFGENAQAITLTKKQVAEQSAKSGGAPVVALAPVGNTVSDVVKAGNVATIFAREVANDPRLATPPPAPKKTTSEPVNTGWGNPVGMVSSWIGSIFGGR